MNTPQKRRRRPAEDPIEQLRKETQAGTDPATLRNLGAATAAADHIPLGHRTIQSVYIEARQVEVLKAIAKARSCTMQDLYREAVAKLLDDYVSSAEKSSRKRKSRA